MYNPSCYSKNICLYLKLALNERFKIKATKCVTMLQTVDQ